MKGLDKPGPVGFLVESKHLEPVETRINPEISRAIKRQKETTGVDYWRTSPIPRGGYNNSFTQKKSTIDKIHNLKFDFPNGTLPAIHSPRHPKIQSSSARSRKKLPNGTAALDSLNRSNSTMTFHISGSKDTDMLSPKKASVTDLTCLQLADTLFTHNNGLAPGLYGFSVGKARYMDYIMESMKTRELENENERLENWLQCPVHTDDNFIDAYGLKQRVNSLPALSTAHTEKRRYSPDSSIGRSNVLTSVSIENLKHVSPRTDRGREVRPEDIVIVENKPGRSLKRPSILKQKSTNSDKTVVDVSENSHWNGNMCNNSQDMHGINHCYTPKTNATNFDPSQCITISSSNPSRNATLSRCGMVRNRSVRFNISDEIREYTPSEPICY